MDSLTTPLQSVWSMALSAMTGECEQFIYLFSPTRDCFRSLVQKWLIELGKLR